MRPPRTRSPGQTGWNYLRPRRRPRRGAVEAVRRASPSTSPTIAPRTRTRPSTASCSTTIRNGCAVGVHDRRQLACVAAGHPCTHADRHGEAAARRCVVVNGDKRHEGRRYRRAAAAERRPARTASPAPSEIHVSPRLELRSITAWRERQHPTSGTIRGGAHRTDLRLRRQRPNFSRYSLADLRQNQFSQEFQAVGSLRSSIMCSALYYFTEHASEAAATPSTQPLERRRHGLHGQQPRSVFGTRSRPATRAGIGSWFVQRDSHAEAASYAAVRPGRPGRLRLRHLPPDSRRPLHARQARRRASRRVQTSRPRPCASFHFSTKAGSIRWSRLAIDVSPRHPPLCQLRDRLSRRRRQRPVGDLHRLWARNRQVL